MKRFQTIKTIANNNSSAQTCNERVPTGCTWLDQMLTQNSQHVQ